MKMDAGYDKMNIIFRIFCVYDEPSADLCLHKDLHLSNVHHLAVKRDGVQSIQIEQESDAVEVVPAAAILFFSVVSRLFFPEFQ